MASLEAVEAKYAVEAAVSREAAAGEAARRAAREEEAAQRAAAAAEAARAKADEAVRRAGEREAVVLERERALAAREEALQVRLAFRCLPLRGRKKYTAPLVTAGPRVDGALRLAYALSCRCVVPGQTRSCFITKDSETEPSFSAERFRSQGRHRVDTRAARTAAQRNMTT